MTAAPRVAVVGGGIAGLAAAYEALDLLPDADVTVHESSERLGGKIHTTEFAGLAVDEAADAFLTRVPWAIDLCRRLDLDRDFIAPATGTAQIWHDGRLIPLPQPHVMGVPTDPEALAASGTVSAAAVQALRDDLARTEDPVEAPESVAAMVRRRLGDELLSRFVAPLVGSVYASDCERLDLETGSPQLAAAAEASPSLVRGLLSLKAQSSAPPDAPIFYSVKGGMGRLIDALAAALGDRIRLNAPAKSLVEGDLAGADLVVLACPAHAAAPLVADVSPEAAALIGGIDYASVTLVTLAFDPDDVPVPLDASGFLVPRDAALTITACSYASTKWAHLGTGSVVLRASVGSHGADTAADLDDEALMEAVTADLRTTLGIEAAPSEVRISRWPRSFPQYEVGHLARVQQIEALLDPHGIRPVGAAYRGIGIPACIRQGQDAVRQWSDAVESAAH